MSLRGRGRNDCNGCKEGGRESKQAGRTRTAAATLGGITSAFFLILVSNR